MSILGNVRHLKPNRSEKAETKKIANLAASWYIALPARDLGQKPVEIELFGSKLVAWRGQNGQPIVMELYCSHMGASLAIGKVVEGCLQCPFHSWRYDISGQCVSAPLLDRIPPKAYQAAYITVEKYGYIWVWYGTGKPLFQLPDFPPAEEESYNYMALRLAYNTTTTVRMLAENACDYYHTITLHGQQVSGPVQLTLVDEHLQEQGFFKVVIEYPLNGYVGRLTTIAKFIGLTSKSFITRVNAWPSGSTINNFTDNQERIVLVAGTTPIADNNTNVYFLVMVNKSGNVLLDLLLFRLFKWQTNRAFGKEDVPIFNNLKTEAGRAFVKFDQGIIKFREFYQYWVDKVV